jgi:hypothetical protein
MTDINDMKLKLALLHDHMPALASVSALLVIHPDLPAIIKIDHRNCADPTSVCQGISLRWKCIRGDREDTYECAEFPLKLVYEKPIIRRQTIPEEVVFSEQQ